MQLKFIILIFNVLIINTLAFSQKNPLKVKINQLVDKIEPKVIEWRRDFHQFPELSNREFKTSEKVEKHLRALGLEVQTKVAHTGLVAILKGGKPGPVIALRADMDALPVIERNDLPFKSVEKSTYNGLDVGVMHACGHDSHTAILMGVAEILSQVKNEIKGTIKFIFQPAEEGAPLGEEGGAELMVKQGVMDNPKVEVVFGLHINSQTEVGTIKYRPRGLMAAADKFKIVVKGVGTHGANPWSGIDPIVVSAQVINSLQTIISRQTELVKDPAVITIGTIHGGVRNNIIPEEVVMEGTVRTFDPEMREKIFAKMETTVVNVAEASGAKGELTIYRQYPVTFNDPKLTEQMLPSLVESAGDGKVILTQAWTGSEDFSFLAQKAPGFFFFLGGMPKGKKESDAAPHHTPGFYLDESGFKLGLKTFCNLVIDYAEKIKK
jgi:amidohydrolase